MTRHDEGEITKVLVVGGAGYVGGAVTDILDERGYEIKVYDSLMFDADFRKPIPFVRGDVRDSARMLSQLEWADAVIWLAAIVGDEACARDPEAAVSVNQDSVKWLADHCTKRMIFPSSCSVYGAQDQLLSESSPTSPLSTYASTKLAAEKYLESSNSLIFRTGTLFGIGDEYSRIRLDLVVNAFTVKALKEGRLTVLGGEQYRPLLHVRDAARVICDNLETPYTGIFNIHRQNIRIIELADKIREHFPDVKIDIAPRSIADTRNYRVTSEKAEKELGFRPTLTLDEGIEELKMKYEKHVI